MKPDDFDFVSKLLKGQSGLSLTPDKVYLLESRLLPVARSRGYKDIAELITMLRSGGPKEIVTEVVEAMTTNESSFFRDSRPFDQLRQKVIPKMLVENAASKRIRIWSAAASTGQEAYSIAMCLAEEKAKLAGWQIEIVGTDIANRVLDKARKGVYTQFEVQRGLPIQLLLKYFTQVEENHWQISEELRKMVNYRMQNLLEEFTVMGQFDIIFCRNVLIYFDDVTKMKVLERLSKCLSPGGILYLGSTETLLGIANKFKTLEDERGLYVLAA